jgi:hypothetical protein
MSIAKTYAEERPEPIATILELAADYGMEEVLRSLSDLALFDSEDTDACNNCRAHGQILHEGLEQLLKRIE